MARIRVFDATGAEPRRPVTPCSSLPSINIIDLSAAP